MHSGLLDRVLAASAGTAAAAGLLFASPAGGGTQPLSAGWRIVPSPPLSGGELIGVSAASPTEAWAVGSRALGGVFEPLALHWNGSQWSSTQISGPGSFSMLRAVADISATDAWAVGVGGSWGALIEHWDGSSWQIVSSPVSGGGTPLYGIKAFGPDDVWAVGGNGLHGLALHFDGTSWTNVTLPEPLGASITSFSDVDGTSGSDVWVVGESETDSQQPVTEHFDGKSWTLVPSPPSGGDYAYVRGLDVRTAGDVWLVGDTLGPPPQYLEQPLVQHWSGSSWSNVPTTIGEPWAVAALSPADAWIVGNEATPSEAYKTMIEHWDGTSWSRTPMLMTTAGDSELNDVEALPNGMVWAVGSYSPNGPDQPLVELNAAG